MKNKEYDLRERKPATDDSDDESDQEESDTEGLLNDDDALIDDSGLEILQTDLSSPRQTTMFNKNLRSLAELFLPASFRVV